MHEDPKPQMSLATFFKIRLEHITQLLRTGPTHVSGPKRPTLTDQEENGSK